MEIEWLILADAAQVTGGKLFLLGGGWEVLTVNSGFQMARPCALALAIRVPWNETNQQHSFEVEVTDEDGKKQLAKLDGQFEVGRPPGISQGQEQRIQLAAGMSLTIGQPGRYAIAASVDGKESAHTGFNVVQGPMLAAKNRVRRRRRPKSES